MRSRDRESESKEAIGQPDVKRNPVEQKIIDISDLARAVSEFHGISNEGRYSAMAALFGVEVIERRRPKKAK